MANSRYRGLRVPTSGYRPPIVPNGNNTEKYYVYENSNVGYPSMPMPQASFLERIVPPWDAHTVQPMSPFPLGYGSGTAPHQMGGHLQVITNHNNIQPGGSEGRFVQSPSSYGSPSPNSCGVPSIRRCKIIKIALSEGQYMRVDLTRCLCGKELREAIISELLNTTDPPISQFDIFRDYPPVPAPSVALNDQQLMLDVEHFGDAEGSLRLSVWGTKANSNPYWPRAELAPTSSYPRLPYPIHTGPSFPVNSKTSMVGHYGSEASTTTNASSQSSRYPTSPSSCTSFPGSTYTAVTMPIPMPAPAPRNEYEYSPAPGFPTAGSCNTSNPTSGNSTFRSPITRGEVPRPGSVIIDGTMATEEILSHLYARGCRNLTEYLDESTFSREPVASGGAADVYTGWLYTGQRVGVKCIRMTNAAISDEGRSKRKASIVSYTPFCRHPNVLELIGITQYRNRIAMVSPWMENGDLRSFLHSYPDADRYELCAQMADGVAYLHSQNIVHGDIKGANVLISKEFVLKIADFGTSALKDYTLAFAQTGTKPGMTIRWTASYLHTIMAGYD
ncbi:Protein tyrosine kinase [Rhizoctonia solani]|uniref:Protein tyrosine kinase n=2 Tax=Rhizoctonia solani TaxID=456999 RepID=A0A8H7HBU5_9AGAM|nr:Protein tyrosine kinase [Rhizoctonia solani]